MRDNVYMVYEHDGSLGPRETEYVGPFPTVDAAVAFVNVWGGTIGVPKVLDTPPPQDMTRSPEWVMEYQKRRF
jgi:hypothetical protein